jgi:hypothetical protein
MRIVLMFWSTNVRSFFRSNSRYTLQSFVLVTLSAVEGLSWHKRISTAHERSELAKQSGLGQLHPNEHLSENLQ